MMMVLALIAIGAMLGGVLVFPIAYALGAEHTHRGTVDTMRELRARRRA